MSTGAEPSPRFAAGQMIGRYVVEDLLGEGGMGAVYRARDTVLGRRVALKVIHRPDPDPVRGEGTRRLMREARAAAALDHPNAVSIFDVGEADGLPFIALELVDGHTLRRYVGAPEPDLAQRVRWLTDVAAVLAAAHEEQLVHRDIKPENVMIRRDGQVKVLDFGIARRVKPLEGSLSKSSLPPTSTDAGLPTLTGIGEMVGTPAYMAPEQIRGERVDGRTDQFAWGVLAYELLTGRLPWSGPAFALMARILTIPLEPIRARNPEIPERVAAVITRALSKAPGDRFRSMKDAIAVLEGFASAAPPAPPAPPTPPTPPTPPVVPESSAAPTVPGPRDERPSFATMRSGEPLPASLAPRSDRRWLALVVLPIVLGLFVAWRVLRPAPPAPASPPPSVAPAAPSAMAVTDLPAPASSSSQAIAAFRAGLRALRFGGYATDFERALALDPALGAAHLQLAVDATEGDIDEPAREHLRAAARLRASLSERDRALLDAFEPIVLRQPSDWAESGRRLGAATERFPGDAQLWFERAWAAVHGEPFETSNGYLARALALDPSYAHAMDGYAENLAYLGRFDEARRALARCIELAPTFVACPKSLQRIAEQEGTCEEMETLARQVIAASPSQHVGYAALARALASRGKGPDVVREALKQKWATMPEAERQQDELRDTIDAAMLAGDFVAAERSARAALAGAVESSKRESEHGLSARLLAQILEETGRPSEAGRVASAFLVKRDTWEPDPRAEDYALAADATPILLATALRAGRITRAEQGAQRAAWSRAWEAKIPAPYRRYLWVHTWAAPVATADEAREALAALPASEPLPRFLPRTMVEAAVGVTFLLGGRAEDALPWLERATRTCRALDFPVEHTRAHHWLGQAREAAGDRDGACAAYRVVRERWGRAKPRSVTAQRAAERAKALRCEP